MLCGVPLNCQSSQLDRYEERYIAVDQGRREKKISGEADISGPPQPALVCKVCEVLP